MYRITIERRLLDPLLRKRPNMADNKSDPLSVANDLYDALQILLDQIQCYCDAFNGTGICPVHQAETTLAHARESGICGTTGESNASESGRRHVPGAPS